VNGKQLINILKKYGWELDRIKGSHYILVKEEKRSIPVPVHGSKDLPPGLVSAILKQADIKKGDLK